MFKSINNIYWTDSTNALSSKSFSCGYCGKESHSTHGYYCKDNQNRYLAYIYLCSCGNPTFFYNETQVPSPAYGEELHHLTPEIKTLYDGARNCMSINAYSSAVLTCRKILMHVAVKEGATEGQKFVTYVDYLSENVLSKKHKSWVDTIRTMGNDENHDIRVANQNEAKMIIDFTEMLLKIVYEYPEKAKQTGASTPTSNTSPKIIGITGVKP